jgi:hypothetical protein
MTGSAFADLGGKKKSALQLANSFACLLAQARASAHQQRRRMTALTQIL